MRFLSRTEVRGEIGLAAALLVVQMTLALPPAQADLKVTARVSMEYGNVAKKASESREFTLWFKGDRARIDLPSGASILLNGTRNHAYVVDPNRHTFYAREIVDSPKRKRLSTTSVVLALQPSDIPFVRSAAGFETHSYSLACSSADSSTNDGTGLEAIASGELWTSPNLALPTLSKPVLRVFAELIGAGSALQEPLADKLIALGQFPLISKISMTDHVSALSNRKVTIVTRFRVLSVSAEDLNDSLFALSESYAEVSPSSTGTQTAGSDGRSSGGSGSGRLASSASGAGGDSGDGDDGPPDDGGGPMPGMGPGDGGGSGGGGPDGGPGGGGPP
ncbi:MAG: hypothetical protein P4L33_01710 [Capsulimonadaceae bacterium]|nr:hypothetical protein [Capsulimonadaceae bacterium]